ncbi:MAG: caspase family protein, partial [Prevotellaceae bacterium]|nr:caspase family protein [Prevotellaceae bacterium]
QASGAAWGAQEFMKNIETKILKYNMSNENHVLNGILFEIYFNSYGDFRSNKTKKYYFEEVINLRKNLTLEKSFDFINLLLISTQYPLIYFPKQTDEILDINIIATEKEKTNDFEENQKCQIINSIMYNNIDITKQIAELHRYGLKTKKDVIQNIANFLTAPVSLIDIHCEIELTSIRFEKDIYDDLF